MIEVEIGNEGITPDLMTKASRPAPIPAKTYEFQIADITVGNTQEGRPRWGCALQVINDPMFPNTKLFYSIYPPWINPQTGTWDVSLGFLLVDMMKGTGKVWEGDLRRPEVQEAYRESLKGATGFMRVGQKPNREDASWLENTVRVVAAKRV